MKKLLLIFLLCIPFFAYPQAQKAYRAIIVDSLKGLNNGSVDINDTARFLLPEIMFFQGGTLRGLLQRPTLTANHTWRLPDSTGTFALLSNVSNLDLAGVLTSGNTSGSTDLIITAGQKITSDKIEGTTAGTAQIALNQFEGDDTWITSDGVGTIGGAMYVSGTEAAFYWQNTPLLQFTTTGAFFRNSEAGNIGDIQMDGTGVHMSGVKDINFYETGVISGTLDAATLTVNRNWKFPNADGTIALQGAAFAGTSISLDEAIPFNDESPMVELYNSAPESTTGGAGTEMATDYFADNVGDNKTQYARYGSEVVDATAGDEDGKFFWDITQAGALINKMQLTNQGLEINTLVEKDASTGVTIESLRTEDVGAYVNQHVPGVADGMIEYNRYDGGGGVVITCDSGAFSDDGAFWVSHTRAALYWDANEVLGASSTGALMTSGISGTKLTIMNHNETRVTSGESGHSRVGLLMGDNSSSVLTSNDIANLGVVLNSQDAQANIGVTNTVIAGGNDITAKTSDALYTNKISLQPATNLFDGLLVPPALGADRTWTFPDATGTVSLQETSGIYGGTDTIPTTTTAVVTDNFWISDADGQNFIRTSAASTNVIIYTGDQLTTTFDADGVGINVDASASLNVRGFNATASSYGFLVEDNVGTDIFKVENDGKVGINTSNPGFQFHQVTPTATAVTYLRIEDNVGADILNVNGNGVLAIGPTEGAIPGNASLQTMARTTGANQGHCYSILSTGKVQRGWWGVNSTGDGGYFGLRSSAGGVNTLLTSIAGDSAYVQGDGGNFGIGTEDPQHQLDVLGDIHTDSVISTPVTTTTLGAAATTFAVKSQVLTLTGDGGANTIATLTNGRAGMIMTLLFVDALVTITDDNTHAANSVDLSAAFTSADDTILQLLFDGTSWYEISRSVN